METRFDFDPRLVGMLANGANVSAGANAAIKAVAEQGGGRITIPPGTFSAAGIDLSAGVNGQTGYTSIIIEGSGMSTGFGGGGTVIDARTLADHVFKITGGRFNVTLRNLTILPHPEFDGIHFDGYPSAVGSLTLENIMVYGGNHGYFLRNTYGDVWFNRLYARKCRRGIYGEYWSAVSCGMLTVRECKELAFELVTGSGFDIKNLYLESNAAEAMHIHGTCYASHIGPVYAENNNTGGCAAYTVKLGEGLESSSGLKAFSAGPFIIGPQRNAPSDAYLLLARYRGLEIAGLNSAGLDITAPIIRVSDACGYALALLLKNIVTSSMSIDVANAQNDSVTYQNCYIL